ncbi:MAG: hypothetical protein Q7U04_07835 [Bacteriovorax sp.]|nr:hypothetical protein [Bacteriovorax sp.]
MKLAMVLGLVLSSINLAHADNSISDQIQVKSNNVKRAVKEGVNQMKEMACSKGDAKCLAEKAKHRIEEGAEVISDKTNETVHKIK